MSGFRTHFFFVGSNVGNSKSEIHNGRSNWNESDLISPPSTVPYHTHATNQPSNHLSSNSPPHSTPSTNHQHIHFNKKKKNIFFFFTSSTQEIPNISPFDFIRIHFSFSFLAYDPTILTIIHQQTSPHRISCHLFCKSSNFNERF